MILVGDNPASQVYVRNKVKACEEAGIHSRLEKYDASMSEAELLARVDALNNDPTIHGILVQLPLPKHIDDHKVIESISPAKDVDGFHVASAGAWWSASRASRPARPWLHEDARIAGHGRPARQARRRHVGRSNIVGKAHGPDAAGGQCHRDCSPQRHGRPWRHDPSGRHRGGRRGKRNVLTADMVKPGAVIIDVGMNRNDEGKLCGDVDFDGVKEVAGWITPCPAASAR